MAIYYVVEGREFVPGEGKKARAYAQQLADERGTPVSLKMEHTYITRDPSGFVYDAEVYKTSVKQIKPKKRSNHRRTSSNPPQAPLPRGRWIKAQVRVTSDGKIQARLPASLAARKNKKRQR